MVYDFTGMRDECYHLYITQNRTLDEIQEHFRRDGWNPRYVGCRTTERYFSLISNSNIFSASRLLRGCSCSTIPYTVLS